MGRFVYNVWDDRTGVISSRWWNGKKMKEEEERGNVTVEKHNLQLGPSSGQSSRWWWWWLGFFSAHATSMLTVPKSVFRLHPFSFLFVTLSLCLRLSLTSFSLSLCLSLLLLPLFWDFTERFSMQNEMVVVKFYNQYFHDWPVLDCFSDCFSFLVNHLLLCFLVNHKCLEICAVVGT